VHSRGEPTRIDRGRRVLRLQVCASHSLCAAVDVLELLHFAGVRARALAILDSVPGAV
jgi:hypothetical protein